MASRELVKSKSAPREISGLVGDGDSNLDQLSGSNSNQESDIFSFLRQVQSKLICLQDSFMGLVSAL